MGNKKVLVITNSVYQLFTAVHMKRALLKSCDVDLIVTDVTPVSYTHLDVYKRQALSIAYVLPTPAA